MNSRWTSKHAIMRDLARAQGRFVPADMAQTVGAGEKPPTLDLIEDTEEEFYQHCSGNVDFSEAPDLGLIKEMLDMVRDVNVSPDSSEFGIEEIVEISKLNPNCNEFKPKCTLDPIINSKDSTNVKRKRERNVAITSLLAALADKQKEKENTASNVVQIKLLKPNDFVTDKAVADSVQKVDAWLNNKTNNSLPVKRGPSLTPVLMFKKKSISEKSVTSEKEKTKPQSPPSQCNTTYTNPSPLANEYYLKYLERAKKNEHIKEKQEDIWTKVERLMKEHELKKLAKQTTKSSGEENSKLTSGEENSKLTSEEENSKLPSGDETPSDQSFLEQYRSELGFSCPCHCHSRCPALLKRAVFVRKSKYRQRERQCVFTFSGSM